MRTCFPYLNLVIVMLAMGGTKAQAQTYLHPVASSILKADKFLFFSHHFYLPANNQGVTPLNHPATNLLLKPMESSTTKALPFFCAMECRLHKYTNLWIKVRTGNDDSYMKMIKASNE